LRISHRLGILFIIKHEFKLPLLDLIPPQRRKLVGWLVGLLLAYTLLGFLILPPIIRAIAVKQISKQLGREVSIQKLRLNPFVLSATIRGLLIRDNDGQPFVSWDEVYANFQLISFFVHPWVFKEVSTTKPFVRVQVNKDYTFNFSDLVTKFSTNAPSKEPSKPLALRIDRFRIQGASASLTDLTPRTAFQRTLGPVDVTLVNFQTDPANKNPYSVAGTTDAGEKFSWSGYFYLAPLRSQGDFSLENFSLNKYGPLYQDFVKFRVTDGIAALRSTYHFELSGSNTVAWVTNTSANLRSFKVAESETGPEIVLLPECTVSGVSADTQARQTEVGSVSVNGAKLLVRRDKNDGINLVEASKPSQPGANTPGGVLLLLKGLTNAVSLFLGTTNTWTGAIRDVQARNCALQVEDLANSRPVHLNLDGIEFSAKNISNLPGTNLTASLSLRWNTNGAVKTDVQASVSPLSADIHFGLDQLDLRSLDPYLEPILNVFIRGSKLSMDSRIKMRDGDDKLPVITYQGDVRLDDFATVDGVLEQEMLKWSSVRFSGIDAKLNPPEVTVKEISVDDAYAHAVIETNHTINLFAALKMSDTNAAPSSHEAPNKKQPPEKSVKTEQANISVETNNLSAFPLPKISVGSVVISNAQLHFTDRSVSPSVDLSVQQVGGTINGLSTEELGHADLAMHAVVDNIGPVDVTGKLNLLSLRGGPGSTGSPPGTNEIKIVVKNVDLTPTSPYVGRFAGYRLEQGKLQMDLTYHIRNRQIQSENLIELDRFTLGDKVNSPDATKLPVRLAVAVLKDRDGKIKLDVPIEGSLDDPEFRLHKVIVHALANVITKIATSPFAALSAVFGGKGEELSYQDFAPGSVVLQNPDKLDSLAKGMFERPGLQLEVQGSVDPDADREGLRRVAVEKQLQQAKWMTLRKSERETLKPEQVTLTSDERLKLLKQIYGDALSKGEIPPSAISAVTGGSPEAAARLIAELRRSGPEKEASMLMKKSTVSPAPAQGQGKTSVAPEGGLAGTLAQILANTINITDSDFQNLASARAKAVREYLIQNGKVEPERVLLAENPSEGVKSQGNRAYLQFR
jgi:hypothetical protein